MTDSTLPAAARLSAGMRVQVYRNLNKPGCTYSVRSKSTGRVVAHMSEIALTDVMLVVQAGGRARVLAQQRRNVHAWAEGLLVPTVPDTCSCPVAAAFRPVPAPDTADPTGSTWRRAGYNPYRSATFVDQHTGAPVHRAAAVHLGAAGLHYLPHTDPAATAGK